MKTLIILLSLFVPLTCFGDQLLPIGNKTKGVVTVPDAFYFEQEDHRTIFIMPRKKDLNGPISMRITVLRDLSEVQLSTKMIKEMLLSSDEDKKIVEVNGRFISESKSELTDPTDITWSLRHHSVVGDGLYFTVTIGTAKGREKEPQCKELLDKMPTILANLARRAEKK